MDRRKQYYYALSSQAWRRLYNEYAARVAVDGGSVRGDVDMLSILKNLSDTGRLDQVKLLWYGGAGVKLRTSGVNSYVSKAYSVQLPANDLAQTTELSQPWLSGNIAPNEKPCLLNPNGGSRFLSHPAISFGATEAWSLTIILNHNQTINADEIPFFAGKYTVCGVGVSLAASRNRYIIVNSDGTFASGANDKFNKGFGKVVILQYIAEGNGNVKIYYNGVLDDTITIQSNIIFENFIRGRYGYVRGRAYYYCIQSGALTASQVASEYNTLRALIPERESVTIGSQAWTTSNLDIVCDAQGVVIPEVTDNAAWAALTTPAWCHYNNDSANGAIYGKLYNWYAVKQIDDALAATGSEWRVPTQAQFETLAATLGGASVAGGKMKVAGTSYFASPNTGADNSSGFSALPSGLRNEAGIFSELVSSGFMQSIDKYYLKASYLNDDILIISQAGLEKRGFPIRIVKNL